jgi:hypothetical protein
MSEPDIDGALVGGASLEPRSFAQIVQAAFLNEWVADGRPPTNSPVPEFGACSKIEV